MSEAATELSGVQYCEKKVKETQHLWSAMLYWLSWQWQY